ncbi:MAG TPA: hypothetical protein VHV08_02585 [Pirellulales bacterium]|jgi:hypothetical protein|nr:hypothetical protein [Pirellulales bacterium]
MRTYINAVVTNGNVFGFGQDRVVSSLNDVTYACAAQHLQMWHASKREHGHWDALKRHVAAVMAGAAVVARRLRLAITRPQGLLVRHTSPALVRA